jgi:hypothetical protein
MPTEQPQTGNPNLLRPNNVVGHRLEVMHRLQNSLDSQSELGKELSDRYYLAHEQIYNSPQLKDLVDSTPNLIGRVANGNFEESQLHIADIGLEPLAIKAALARVADGISKAKEYFPAIRTKLEEEGGRYEKDLFRDMSAHVLLVSESVRKVGEFNDDGLPAINAIGTILSNTRIHLSPEPGSLSSEELSIDSLSDARLEDLTFMLAATSTAKQRIESRLVGQGNRDFSGLFLAKCLEGNDTAYANFKRLVDNGPLSFREMTGLSSLAVDLSERIRAVQLPRLSNDQLSVNEYAGNTPGEEKLEDREIPIDQQIEHLRNKASEKLNQANEKVEEAERALELARENATRTFELITSVDHLANQNTHLQELQKIDAAKRTLYEGLSDNPEDRVKELEALALEPPFEQPSEDFYRTLAQIDPGKISTVYEIDKQQIEPSMISLRDASDLIGGTTPIALLKPIFDHHINSLWDIIGQDKLSSGRERLNQASQPLEGIEQLEADIQEIIASLKQDLE